MIIFYRCEKLSWELVLKKYYVNGFIFYALEPTPENIAKYRKETYLIIE